jgi:hypothetical protein
LMSRAPYSPIAVLFVNLEVVPHTWKQPNITTKAHVLPSLTAIRAYEDFRRGVRSVIHPRSITQVSSRCRYVCLYVREWVCACVRARGRCQYCTPRINFLSVWLSVYLSVWRANLHR